jgi:hypothetical protein
MEDPHPDEVLPYYRLAFSGCSRFSLWNNERIAILMTYEETIGLPVGEHEK